jgi:hypothetical protein
MRIALARGRLDRFHGAIVALACLELLVALGLLVVAPFGVNRLVPALVGVAGLVLLVDHLRQWTGWRRVDVPVELSAHGVVLRRPEAEVAVPWEAVASVERGQLSATQLVRFRLHQPRRSVVFPVRTLAVDLAELDRQVWHWSGGRFRLR